MNVNTSTMWSMEKSAFNDYVSLKVYTRHIDSHKQTMG